MRTKDIQEQLLTFLDFIYAIVFALAVEKTFTSLFTQFTKTSWIPALITLILAGTLFYFLAWDWILGRLLTMKNPYRGYDRFLLEILIAVSSYGAALSVVGGKVHYLVYLGIILMLGAFWAKRTQKELKYLKDDQELCITQSLQFPCAMACFLCFLHRLTFFDGRATTGLMACSVLAIWCFLLAYELAVPRCAGLAGGVSIPFIPRSRLRNTRRRLGNWYNAVWR
jgi:hypothetical protein